MSLRNVAAGGRFTGWVTVAIVSVLFFICWQDLYLPPSLEAAQGGWRTQQGAKQEFYVETPPVPGIPYGKGNQEQRDNLPPEIKEIDERIKRDAEEIIRATPGAGGISVFQPEREKTDLEGINEASKAASKWSLGDAGKGMDPSGEVKKGPETQNEQGGYSSPQVGKQEGVIQKESSQRQDKENPQVSAVVSKGVSKGQSLKESDGMTKGGDPGVGSSRSEIESGGSQETFSRGQEPKLKGPSFLKRGLIVLIIVSGIFLFGRKYLFK